MCSLCLMSMDLRDCPTYDLLVNSWSDFKKCTVQRWDSKGWVLIVLICIHYRRCTAAGHVCVKLGSARFVKGSTEWLIHSSTININLSSRSTTIPGFLLVEKCFTFHGSRSPLPYLQRPTCRPTPEPNESIPYHKILSFKIHFDNINSSSHTSIKWSLPFKFSS